MNYTLITACAASLLTLQTASAIVIDPLAVKLVEPAGSIAQGSFTLQNEHARTIPYTISVHDLSATTSNDSSWLVLDKSEVTLEPGESTTLHYVSTLPKDMIGQRLAKIRFTEAVDGKATTVGIRTSVSIYFVAIAQGTERYDLEIASARLMPGKQELLTIRLKNTGNVYFKPTGTCRIVDLATGHEMSVHELNSEKVSAQPGRPVDIAAHLEDKLPSGRYRLDIELMIPGQEKRFGETLELFIP